MSRALTPGRSTLLLHITRPDAASRAYSSCRTDPPCSATTKTWFVAASQAGVPVIPSGSMSPHCRSSAGDGDPRLCFHTCRYDRSNAYTVSCSVATIVSPRTTTGEA